MKWALIAVAFWGYDEPLRTQYEVMVMGVWPTKERCEVEAKKERAGPWPQYVYAECRPHQPPAHIRPKDQRPRGQQEPKT
jgi:hypothetical protein